MECRLCKDGMHCHIRTVFHMTRERGREGREEREVGKNGTVFQMTREGGSRGEGGERGWEKWKSVSDDQRWGGGRRGEVREERGGREGRGGGGERGGEGGEG